MHRFLVDTMIRADWQKRRLQRLEADLIRKLLAETPGATLIDAMLSDSPAAKLLARIQRQIAAHERAWFRAHRELVRLANCLAAAQQDGMDATSITPRPNTAPPVPLRPSKSPKNPNHRNEPNRPRPRPPNPGRRWTKRPASRSTLSAKLPKTTGLRRNRCRLTTHLTPQFRHSAQSLLPLRARPLPLMWIRLP